MPLYRPPAAQRSVATAENEQSKPTKRLAHETGVRQLNTALSERQASKLAGGAPIPEYRVQIGSLGGLLKAVMLAGVR